MKKILAAIFPILFFVFLVLCFQTFIFLQKEISTNKENLLLKRKLVLSKTEIAKKGEFASIFDLKLLNKTYTYISNKCYYLESYKHNRLAKTYSIEMLQDLMRWNEHEEYKSPHGDGYILYLIFEIRLHKNKITVKCKGYVTGVIVFESENNKIASANYFVTGIYKGKPDTISKDRLKEFENIFNENMDKKECIEDLKSLADIL